MKLRRLSFVVAALAALVVFSQTAVAQSKSVQVRPDAKSRQTVRGTVFSTYSIFPPISTTIGQKGFRPRNPQITSDEPQGPIPEVQSIFSGAPGPNAGPHFPGIGATGWVPPDPDMAVGPNHVVQVVNATIAFFTKGGTMQFQQGATTFLNSVRQTNFLFDPKVVYDRLAQRFVVIFLDEDDGTAVSNVLFAVSDDSDPNGIWFLYRFDVSQVIGGIDSWLDYPGLGYNKDGYVVCGNMFGFAGGNPGTSKYLVIPKIPVLTGAPATTNSFTNTGPSPQAADVVDPVKDTVFAASRLGAPANGALTRFFAFRNLGGIPTMTFTDIAVTNATWVLSLNAQSTSGRFLDALEGRILTATWRNGKMYLSYPFNQGGGFVGTRWAEYDTGSWPVSGTITELQAGNYTSGTLHQFMPAVNVNKHGDVSILFTQSSTAVTANMAVAGRVFSDDPNSMGASTVLVTSPGNNYTAGRWGDYFGIDVDPVDDETFWGTAMVVAASNNWETHIMSWNVSKTWPVAPASFLWLRGVPQSGNVASLTNDDGNYNVAKAGAVLFPTEPPAQIQVEAIAPTGQVLNIDIRAIAMVNTPGLSQKIELWDWVNGTYVQVGTTQLATTVDSIHNASATGTLSNFVQVGTRAVRAKVSFFRTGLTLIWPWTASVDQIQWNIRTR